MALNGVKKTTVKERYLFEYLLQVLVVTCGQKLLLENVTAWPFGTMERCGPGEQAWIVGWEMEIRKTALSQHLCPLLMFLVANG